MRLVLRGITKRFGSVVANDSISLTVEPGEIHCLLGENGAGKSTLMNVLYGLYKADEGEIELDGEVQHFTGPGDAMAAGIGMVHQHFMLIPVFTVAENVMLGNETTGFAGTLDLAEAGKRVTEISERFGFHVNPDAVVEDLPVGVQQRVEIIKALSRDAELLVFDEPTAVLTPQETDELMDIMRQLKEAGKAIVFITHKLREVREVADRITVIRLGKVVGEADPKASNAELASMMVGRPVELVVHKDAAEARRRRAGGQGPPRGRPGRPHAGRRPQLHHPGRRGPRRRRRPGQRPDRAHRGPPRPPGRRQRLHQPRRRRAGRPLDAQDPRRRCRVHPRGPAGRRPRARLHHRREPHAQPQLQVAVRQERLAAPRRPARVRPEEAHGVRRPRPRHRLAGRQPLRRQPAEGRRGARALPRPAPARRRPAHPRRRRRLDRVHPQADRRDPRQRHPGPGGLHRARRGGRARRPHHGALPRQGRRHRRRPTPRARPSDS